MHFLWGPKGPVTPPPRVRVARTGTDSAAFQDEGFFSSLRPSLLLCCGDGDLEPTRRSHPRRVVEDFVSRTTARAKAGERG